MKRDEVPGLGARLKGARVVAGLTQAEVFERSGITPSSQSTFEAGRRTPSVAVLCRLAAAIGVSPCDIIPPTGAEIGEELAPPANVGTPAAAGEAPPADEPAPTGKPDRKRKAAGE